MLSCSWWRHCGANLRLWAWCYFCFCLFNIREGNQARRRFRLVLFLCLFNAFLTVWAPWCEGGARRIQARRWASFIPSFLSWFRSPLPFLLNQVIAVVSNLSHLLQVPHLHLLICISLSENCLWLRRLLSFLPFLPSNFRRTWLLELTLNTLLFLPLLGIEQIWHTVVMNQCDPFLRGLLL